MLTVIILIFAITAVLGLTIAVPLLQGKPTPKPAVALHGIAAAAGLITLILFAVNNASAPIASLVIFIIAAIGGFILLTNDLKKKPGPKALVIIHAGAAVIAFLLLLIFAFS